MFSLCPFRLSQGFFFFLNKNKQLSPDSGDLALGSQELPFSLLASSKEIKAFPWCLWVKHSRQSSDGPTLGYTPSPGPFAVDRRQPTATLLGALLQLGK